MYFCIIQDENIMTFQQKIMRFLLCGILSQMCNSIQQSKNRRFGKRVEKQKSDVACQMYIADTCDDGEERLLIMLQTFRFYRSQSLHHGFSVHVVQSTNIFEPPRSQTTAKNYYEIFGLLETKGRDQRVGVLNNWLMN